MRIVHIIDSLARGGAETLLVGIVNGLTNDEHFIITLSDKNDFKGEAINATIISLNNTSLWALPLAVIALKKQLKKIQPDVIHSHLYWSSIVAKLAVSKKDKYFYTNHCVQSFAAFRNKKLIFLEKLTYKKWHTLISVSGTVEEDYLKYINVTGKHFVLYNFVEDVFFTLHKKEQTGAGVSGVAVGRLADQKNYPYLLDAVHHTTADVTVDIFGDGPEREMLEKKIQDDHITKAHLKLKHSRIYEVLPNYSFFVMTSIYEGQPVSLLEAMAAGMPVLLSDVPVLREVGEDAGIYFSLANSNELTQLLENIASGKINLLPYAEKCRERAKEIALKSRYFEKLKAIYNS